jgi:hypothetical protein
MTAEIVSLRDYRETGNVDASLAAWARRLQKQILSQCSPEMQQRFNQRAASMTNRPGGDAA